MGQHEGLGEGLQPAAQRLQLGARAEAGPQALLEQAGSLLKGRSGQGMGGRLGAAALLRVPAAGAQVQGWGQRGSGLPQALAQDLSKQVVIAKPHPFLIEGEQEQVGLRQEVELCLAVMPATQSIAQGSTQAIQDGGLQQEVLDGFTLTAQDFVQQIVRYVVMAPAERGEEGGRLVTALQGACGELQAGDPALGACLQQGALL